VKDWGEMGEILKKERDKIIDNPFSKPSSKLSRLHTHICTQEGHGNMKEAVATTKTCPF
jgi:hypothetical protein